MTSIRVLIVDDHPIVRDGIAAVLGTQSDLEVAGVAGTGEEAIRQVGALRPNVVLMDLKMPAMDGINTTAAIKATHPDVHWYFPRPAESHYREDARGVDLMRRAGRPTEPASGRTDGLHARVLAGIVILAVLV